jgi:hypothetical protein
MLQNEIDMTQHQPNIYDDEFTIGRDNSLVHASLFENNLKIQKRKLCYKKMMGITCVICTNCISFMVGMIVHNDYYERMGSISC